jgi:large subunit ribosomal protein L10
MSDYSMSDYVVKMQPAKVKALEDLKEAFSGVKDIIFTDYRGLTVAQITELRDKLREQQAVYKVVKNRFTRIVLNDLEMPNVDSHLVGPTAVALAKDESGPVAKTLFDFAKQMPVEVKGGIIAGDVFDASQVEEYSKLPTRLDLIAMLMSTMNAPLQNFVGTMNAIPSQLVRVLQAVADKKAEE